MGDEHLAGTTLGNGRYDVLELLGAGGMGAVYRARDRELDELVALKVLRSELGGRVLDMFRREVKLARRVTHPNVARIYELGHSDGITYCTMELIDGESLLARLERSPIPIDETIAIVRAVCDGLSAAHAAGVIHRDIKPDNVLLARDGRIVLADFGVASAREASSDRSGTPEYMAPEQALGEPPTPATDIYALGVVLAELVIGRRLFSGPTMQVLFAKHELAFVDLGATDPPELAGVIARATAREPANRTASARELADALDKLSHARVGAAAARDFAAQPRAMREVPTVLVVPPAASDAEALPIALGVHEALLVRLMALRGIRVVPRATATAEPADCVVEIAATNVMTITISRPNGAPHVLRSPIAISEVEGVAAAAASVVDAALSGEIRNEREHGAMELLLQARAVVQRDGTQIQAARELLERASRIAPGNARVLAALAMLDVRNTFYVDITPAQLADMRVQVGTALACGPELPDAHLAAGHLELAFGEPAIAARHFRTAIARAPHLADAHDLLGRMLVEAGFLDEGYARLEDAFAIAPVLSSARWDIARAFALLGRWDDADRLVRELVATGVDRIIGRLRFAWWRRDASSMNAEACAVWQRGGRLFQPRLMLAVFDSLADPTHATWYARRTEILEQVMPMANHRRFAFAAQLVAEVAAQCDDFDTAMSMVEYAVGANLFDLLWMDRCPLLEPLRNHQRFRELRAGVKHRAEGILDALYGDSAGSIAAAAPPTVIV